MNNLEDVRRTLAAFVAEREWDQFHTPKNIAMALSVEASELLECFQWLTPEQSTSPDPEQRSAIRDEIADVQLYLVRLAELLDVDILDACAAKMEKNAAKYPVELARGRADKYTRLGHGADGTDDGAPA